MKLLVKDTILRTTRYNTNTSSNRKFTNLLPNHILKDTNS